MTSARLSNGSTTYEVPFAPGLTVVSGGNGAGKTGLLETIAKCLSGRDPVARLPHWLTSAEISGTHGDEPWTASYDVATGSRAGRCPVPVEYIDASAETDRLLSQVRQDDNHLDLIEGLDPVYFDRDQVELLGYVLRRGYEEVRVFEVTSFSDDETPIPYFQVVSKGKSYDLLEMGRGELAAAYLLWRLGAVDKGSLVLVEEPESHLASFSQDMLAEAMIGTVVERGLTLVVSSHSPGFVRLLRQGSVVLVAASPAPSFRSPGPVEVATHLGLRPSRDAVLLTEDRVAEFVLREVLARTAPDLLHRVSTRFAPDGESAVVRSVAQFGRSVDADGFVVLGVLDGDRREAGPGHGYLPGAQAPELVLRGVVDQWRQGRFPEWEPTLAGGPERFGMLLEECDGLDHHDWLAELGKRCGGDGRVVGELVPLCLRDPVLAGHADELVEWIRGRLRR
ncbi:AAA family ATPase [Actinosynnema sp. NPDC020468]|uniref:AAA family ATPase n=1 Tax=Actinosynnema sp. NPDC020468 TaxID=3154488 RepID=UPI0033EE3717